MAKDWFEGLRPSPGTKPPLATEELATRPAAARERAAIEPWIESLLQHAEGESADVALQRLSDFALDACGAGSAGVSIEEPSPGGGRLFRWRAVSGFLAPQLGGTMPRDFSPCGDVVDSGRPQLMIEPVRYYEYIAAFPHIHEALLVPLADPAGRASGTLWVVHHAEGPYFDRDDSDALTRLAHAGSVAWSAARAAAG